MNIIQTTNNNIFIKTFIDFYPAFIIIFIGNNILFFYFLAYFKEL